jgi:hypothetical protein
VGGSNYSKNCPGNILDYFPKFPAGIFFLTFKQVETENGKITTIPCHFLEKFLSKVFSDNLNSKHQVLIIFGVQINYGYSVYQICPNSENTKYFGLASRIRTRHVACADVNTPSTESHSINFDLVLGNLTKIST